MRLALGIVAVFLIGASAGDAVIKNEIPGSSNPNGTSNGTFHPILLECQNSDYQAYIHCLRRHKRHHEHHDYSDGTKDCLNHCEVDRCITTHCVQQCHLKCMKKVKETRQFVTEFESVCTEPDCTSKEASPIVPNITTNIGINHVIHNHIKTEHPPPPPPPSPPPPTPPPPPPPPRVTTPLPPIGFPPIKIVSQITLGGCINWPCIESSQLPDFDCSLCINIWFKYQCEVHCCNVRVPGPQGSTPFVCSGHG